MAGSTLHWDWGTAYDLFISLDVLHEPSDYGVRPKWAAGVRARLPADARQMLEEAQSLFSHRPLHWVHSLPDPKDGATALWVLRQTPPAGRLAALSLLPTVPAAIKEILYSVAELRTWNKGQAEALRTAYEAEQGDNCLSDQSLANLLKWWSRADEFGERYLAALQSYQDVFFAEEEERIHPALQAALARAQDLAQRMALPALFEELSQGLRFGDLDRVAEWVLAPSFWSTPLVCFGQAGLDRNIMLFGARPADASLVPGEVVPETLLRTLKALSDPTRLRILRFLAEESLTPAELSRRLRLRPQTVIHHLQILRLAGLVQVTVGGGRGSVGEPHAARFEAMSAALASLHDFLLIEQSEALEVEPGSGGVR